MWDLWATHLLNQDNWVSLKKCILKTLWEIKFLEHSPKHKCLFYVLYKIPGQFSIWSAQNLLTWSSGRVLVSLTVETISLWYDLLKMVIVCSSLTPNHYMNQYWPKTADEFAVYILFYRVTSESGFSIKMSPFLFINSSPPGQNDRHFTDNIFIYIFVNKNFVF